MTEALFPLIPAFFFREFDEKLELTQTLSNHLHLNDTRSYFVHSNENLLSQKIYQIIAGYAEDDAADQLTEDPVFTEVLDTPALASQPSLSRFWERFDANSIAQLQQANQELLDKVHHHRKSTAIIFDLEPLFDLIVRKAKRMFSLDTMIS